MLADYLAARDHAQALQQTLDIGRAEVVADPDRRGAIRFTLKDLSPEQAAWLVGLAQRVFAAGKM